MTEQKTDQLRLRRINLRIWIAIITLTLAALMSYFLVDERFFSWLCQHRSNWQKNSWLQVFILLGKGWVLIWLLLCWVWATGQHRPALVAILVLLLVLPAVVSLKSIVQRPRPEDVEDVIKSGIEERNAFVRSWSFPSGDTAAVFAVATTLASFIRWPWVLTFFTVASSIGILRVAVLAHYSSDVCGGAAIGMLISWLASQIASRCRLPESSGFNWYRAMAAAGVIGIPLFLGLLEGIEQLLTFLKTYGVLVAGIYLVAKASTLLKRLQRRDSCDH
jgi:undecaprenyl-diphosphatase